MKIFHPSDTIVEDLTEVVKILEKKDDRPVLTYSVAKLRDELRAIWNEQHKGSPFKRGIPREIPDDVCAKSSTRRIAVAAVCLHAIIAKEGSCTRIGDKSLAQQVEDAYFYADRLIDAASASTPDFPAE